VAEAKKQLSRNTENKTLVVMLEIAEMGKEPLELRIMASVTIKVERDVMNNQRLLLFVDRKGLFFT
jgi:hypothetical protein